jgi:thioredoxin-related protein
MKKQIVTLTLILGFIGLSFHSSEIKSLSIGDTAPLTKYKMASTLGGKISLEELKSDNGLLVIFSCNTCPFVVGGRDFTGWEKDYNAIHKMTSDAKIGAVLVNSNEAKRKDGDNLNDMKSRAKEQGYTMPYVLDKDHQLADAFGAKTTPHVFLFDKNMKLVYMGAIDNQWNPTANERENHLHDAIQALVSGTDINKNTTAPKGCSIKRKS